ncbi:MAG: helix-turn-helix domain-containing protein [Oscillospiraceae bacterium]|nr:helix-turn-helix domain-containing protein [Oscillospiraceae bacterium]
MKYEQYPSRSAKRNYFPLPNEIFSLGLSTGEIATYAYLMRCEDRETYQCYPSYETIGEAIGKTKNTVMKYVHGLEEKHLIYTEPTTVWGKGGLKRNGNLCFTIRPIEEAKRYHVEQQMRENERKKLEEQVA